MERGTEKSRKEKEKKKRDQEGNLIGWGRDKGGRW